MVHRVKSKKFVEMKQKILSSEKSLLNDMLKTKKMEIKKLDKKIKMEKQFINLVKKTKSFGQLNNLVKKWQGGTIKEVYSWL